MTHKAEITVAGLESKFSVGQNVIYALSDFGLKNRENIDLENDMVWTGTIIRVDIMFQEKISFDLRNNNPFRSKNSRIEYDVYNGTEIIRCHEWQLFPAVDLETREGK